MQRLLIIGCGDVARRALPRLVQRYRVYALLRTAEPQLTAELRRLGVRLLHGDLDAPLTLRRLAGLADVVLHCAPPPERGACDLRTRRLIAALRRGAHPLQRLVYISTSGVYGDCQGAHVRETRRVAPRTARAIRRVDAERQLRHWGASGGPCLSILRAPGIYAAERLPLERIRRGDPVLQRADDVFTNHIHADDLAACVLAALHRGAANRVYHASDSSADADGQPGLRMGDWFDAVADAHALPRPPRVSRNEATVRLTPLVLSFMAESRRLDNTRLRRELQLRLTYPDVGAGLAASAAAASPTPPATLTPPRQES